MRILFLEDGGIAGLARYVRECGDEPVVVRTGVYDDWQEREDPGPGTRVVELPRDADARQIAEAAAGLKPDALVSLAMLDPHVQRDAAVAAALRPRLGGQAVANSPQATARATDKHATKAVLQSHGIAVTRAIRVENRMTARAAAEALGYPIVIKRNEGYSGAGMRLVETPAQLDAYYRRAPGDVLLEAFMEGIELSVNVLAWGDACRGLPVVSKGETDRNLRRHPIYRFRLAPHPLPEAVAARVRFIAEEAVRALGLVGVAECEMILGSDGEARVLEVNPRISGTLRLAAGASGVDPCRCLVDMARGCFDARVRHARPAVTAQVPLAEALDEASRARMRAQPEVRHIKPIDWMPGLGVRNTITVQASDAAALVGWLDRQDGYGGFGDASRKLRFLFGMENHHARNTDDRASGHQAPSATTVSLSPG